MAHFRLLMFPLLVIVGASIASAADVKNGLIAEYFSDESFVNLEGKRLDPNIDWYWTDVGPRPGMSGEHFSVRWTGWIKAPKAGKYKLILVGDEGSRLFLDGKPCIDAWNRGNHVVSGTADLTGAPQPIVVEYFENTGDTRLTLFWQPLGFPTPSIVPSSVLFPTEEDAQAKVNKKKLPERGLIADYFDVDFKQSFGRSVIHRTESLWGDWSADLGVPTDAGVRYSGFLVPDQTGSYRFEAYADDVLQVWIDEKPVLEATLERNKGFANAYVELRANKPHAIRMEFLDSTAFGGFYLHWVPPGSTQETIIPGDMLYPTKKSLPKLDVGTK